VLAAFGAVSGFLALFCLIPVLDDVFSSVKALFLSLRGGRRSLEYALERLGAAFLKLSLLAFESFVCLSAAVTALVRMVFTRRHMLQWVTAAQAERSERTVDAYIKKMFFSILSGAAVIAAAQNVWFFALGFVWLISPLTAYLYSRPRKKAKAIDKSKTDWLLSQAKMMAAYYEDTMTEKTGWLPPDNVQLKPWKGTAMRTSPTNIGLALLAIVSANILGLWDDDKAAELIDRCLKTVLKLEKWQGHLYNWYSLVTLEPLAPGDISSVDSGNLCACLVAVKEAMRTLKSPEAESAALAAEQLIEQMDFSPLYDREQSLLKVFVRPGENVSSGCYDLLASEARLAYFTAVALGKADKRIWHALSRASSKAGGLRPLVSWSGTMFEYLMPRLLLTEYDGSLLDRSGKDCVKVQRSAAGKDGLWGISESCYYSFDETLDYRYKAHGVQALALSRCRSGEKVISPYSSFLALETAPGAAAENLLRLESVGAGGEWGLCEAVDLTPSRGARGRGAVVSCFMAHHLGMSLASVCNYLTDGALRRLFLSDSRIRAWQILLKERAQTVCNAAEPGVSYDVLPGRHKVRPPISDDGLGLAMQDCCLLSNGLFSFVSDRTGRQSIRCGGAEVTEGAIVWTLTDGQSEYTVTPLDAFEAEHSSVFSSDSCVFTLCKNGLECSLETAVVHSRAGLVQKLTVKNKSSQSRTVTVRAEFTPVLENAAAYYSHPAFSKLFLNAKQTGSGVTVQRRKCEGGHSACLHARL
ncbi:MAG: hypothetical protein IKM51_03445, partial [Oscillospiraceae bacterium]|nr:hypothetical protein [Oscillospiraceae bacterium]